MVPLSLLSHVCDEVRQLVLVPAVTVEIAATDRIRSVGRGRWGVGGSRQVRLSSPLVSARVGRSTFNPAGRHILYAAQITRRTWLRFRVSGGSSGP